jgi:Tfp pilus assembly protein PilO
MIVFIIYPLIRDIRENSAEFISQKQKLADLEEKIKNLNDFKILYKEYKPNLDIIDNLFIDSEVPVDFIAFLENTAKNCQLEIRISPSSSKSKDEFGYYLGFNVSLAGIPDNLMKFIDKIENAPYLIKINSVIANRSTDDSGKETASANTSFNVYVK